MREITGLSGIVRTQVIAQPSPAKAKLASSISGDTVIIKRIVWGLGGLVALVFGGELIIHPLGEGILLLLESLEMAVDIGYETLLGLDPYASQKATAWTGALVFIGLLTWGGFVAKRRFERAKAAAPAWWEAKKQEMRGEWAAMSLKEKASYAGGVVAMLTLLALFL